MREEITMKKNNVEKIGKKEVFSKARRVFLQNYGHFFVSRVGNILNCEQTLIMSLWINQISKILKYFSICTNKLLFTQISSLKVIERSEIASK